MRYIVVEVGVPSCLECSHCQKDAGCIGKCELTGKALSKYPAIPKRCPLPERPSAEGREEVA